MRSRSADSMKLELVQVLFRHGERTPLKSEHDAYGADLALYEPYGLEQLTNTGKKQAHDLGLMLRRRYSNFLSPNYTPDGELYAYASDTDRTKATLELVLAGLYPPTLELLWNKELKWTPVPFKCIPRELDLLLNGDKNPRYQKLRSEAMRASPKLRRVTTEHADLLELIRSCASSNNNGGAGVVHAGKTFQIFNVLRIHERMNLPLPDWYTSDKRNQIFDVFHSLLDLMSDSLEMKKIMSGSMIRKLVENVDAGNEKRRARKMCLYSGHDLNVAAVLHGLGIHDAKFPDFASSLIFEKYRDTDAQVYVKILYWQTVGEEMTTLKLKGCSDEYCHVDDFKRIAADVIPTDEELEDLLSHLDAKKLKDFCLSDC